MIQALWHMCHLCMLLLARVLITWTLYFVIYHIIFLVNVPEIFNFKLKVINVIKILHFQVCIFQDLAWNLPDFMNEICQISYIKSTWFHEIHQILHEICQISSMKSTGFHCHEIHWISCEICQISSWNLPDFMASTPLPLNAKYPAYFCISWPWNLADFT